MMDPAKTTPTSTEMTRGTDSSASELATDFSGPKKVGFDELDQLIVLTLPGAILGGAAKTLVDQVNALALEGARGSAAHRLLAREVVLARTSLRFAQAVAHVELERLARGKGDVRRVALLERVVDGGHRRLMAAVDRLARLDPAPTPQLRVSATNAQINVAGGAR